MSEVVNVVVAFAVIVFIFRWVTSSNETPADKAAIEALGFRPKTVSQDMIDTIHSMFPDIPLDNIRYDLLKTGDVERTTNKILEKGFLDAPPAGYYIVYPRTQAPPAAGTTTNASATASGSKPVPAKENLIARFKLQDRVQSLSGAPEIDLKAVGGKAVWEDSAEKREASLKERKAQMVLAARQRMLEKQKAKTAQ